MMRNWKLVGMQLVLASGLAAAPAMAADSDNPAKPPDNAALWKEIQDLKKNLGALDQGVQHTFRSFDDDFGKRIKKLEDESTAMSLKLEKSQSDLTRALTELDDLHRQLAALRQDLDRKSYYVPPSNGTAATRTNMGRVRLINTYYEPVTVLLNGRSYAIEPGETRFSDAMVPGTFTYEVLGIQPALTRTLAANETFTVTVHPQ
jgi:hypothetical protein